jgi:hypothetical protein
MEEALIAEVEVEERSNSFVQQIDEARQISLKFDKET